MKVTYLITILLTILLSGCSTVQRYAHMHSDKAPKPNIYQYRDGGKSIYYDFTINGSEEPDTYVFFYGGSGCPSWKSVMPDYVKGLSVPAKVMVLNKRFVSDRSTGMFDCGTEFYANNNISQWVSDYSEFIATQLKKAHKPPKAVVLVGVSEGGITAVKVAGLMPEITHLAIIGAGGYPMRQSLTTLKQKEKISFDVDAGWKKVTSDPLSMEKNWYGNTYRWWSEIMDYDPMPDYMKLNIPILVGIGEKDSSVPVESAYLLESEFKKVGKSNLTLKVYKGADHRLSDEHRSYRNEFFSLLSQML